MIVAVQCSKLLSPHYIDPPRSGEWVSKRPNPLGAITGGYNGPKPSQGICWALTPGDRVGIGGRDNRNSLFGCAVQVKS